MTEWRIIPGFERYEVSDDGRVRYAATQRERKLHVTRQGYNYVSMHVGPPTEREIGKRNIWSGRRWPSLQAQGHAQ